MNPWSRFTLAVRRKETPFHARLHDIARKILAINMPVVPWLHRFLYHEWSARTATWHNFWRVVYYEPMFKAMCRKVGKGFKLWYAGNGICRINGNLRIDLGDNVIMFDNVGLVGLRVYDDPELIIGDNTYIGPLCRFMTARRIAIGRYCILGSGVMLMDNPGHPVDASERLVPGGGLPKEDKVSPVVIGDFCHIATRSLVYPGSVVGDGVVTKIGTHIKGTVPPFALIEGQPCRVSKLLPIPESMRERVGKERYMAWIAEREAWQAAQQIQTTAETTKIDRERRPEGCPAEAAP